VKLPTGGNGQAAIGVFDPMVVNPALKNGQLQFPTAARCPEKLTAHRFDGLGLKGGIVKELA